MNSYFSKSFFTTNRDRFRRLVTDEIIVVGGNGLLQRSGDSTYHFSQDANFWYLTGLNRADLVLVIDGNDEYLIAPDLTNYQSIFDGATSAETFSGRSGIATIMPEKDGWKRLRNRLATVTSVATFAASSPYVSIYGMYTNPARRTLIRRLKSANKSMKIVDTSAKLAQLRAVKQDAELLAMRQAIQLTNESLDMIAHNISSYGYEYEIEAEVSGYFRKHGALDAWKPMVGSGSNSCILHSSDNVAPIKKGDVIVVDIGAEVEHYCSDITRTFAANNSFTKRQQAVYDAVEAVHTYGINLQHVGASIRENEAKIESFMGEQLMSLGLIDQPDRKAIRHYFPHATSHYLGLNPHDAGDYQAPLEAGMVLTVEPGIYIPEENIGVRIEDDILITDTGYEILSATLPHTLA